MPRPIANGRPRYLVGLLFVLISATGFGVMAPAGRYAYAGGANVWTIGAVRFLVAGALLWLLALATGRVRRLPGRKVLHLLLLGGVGYTLHSSLFFTAIRFISPSLAGVILYIHPAIVVLLSAIFLRERVTVWRLGVVVLCTAGAALASGGGGGAAHVLGIAAVLTGATIYSVYIVVSRPVLEGVDPLLATAWIVSAAGVSYGGIAAVTGTFVTHMTPAAWGAIGVITVVSTFVAILFFFLGIVRVGPAVTALVSSFEPVATIIVSIMAFRDWPNSWQWAGAALVLGGVMLQAVSPSAGRPQSGGAAPHRCALRGRRVSAGGVQP